MSITEHSCDWVDQRSMRARALWAKSGDADAHLSLPQHLVDAACAAEWLWDYWVSGALARSLSALWGLKLDEVRRLYCFLAGVHDVGKASASFQRMAERVPGMDYLLAPLDAAGFERDWPRGEAPHKKFPHGMASALLLRRWLAARGMERQRRVRLASIVDAHHGFTSDPQLLRNAANDTDGRTCAFDDVAFELLDAMCALTDVEDVLEEINLGDVPVADALQVTTGLVIMADWIASNEEAFPYRHVERQDRRVAQAFRCIALPPPWQPVDVPADIDAHLRQIFGWPDRFSPRPVQAAAVEAVRSADEQVLLIIEAPTGEGKTEAALAAAHTLAARNGAQGVFLAAPTMATANGLFERTADWVARSSRDGEVSSMFLAHSKNRLSQPFEQMRFAGIGEDGEYALDDHGADTKDAPTGSTVVATEWLSGTKRGILADFVVGTIDQVLMLALQARFSMLRHLGLAGKIVIIDEVHAYDAYMSQYLYRTLEWLARYGASVILMSATLPPAQRKRLAEAYGSQLIDADAHTYAALDSHAYPLISRVDSTGVRAISIAARPTDAELQVHQLDDSIDTLLSTLSVLRIDGGIALIICNTISRAQAVYRVLVEEFGGTEVVLHHSAFVATQRHAKEDELRAELGPDARRGNGRPAQKIIVATQVAEQSLDIDADLLITDIAPIDLIIQRAGRLHRHVRPVSDRPEALRTPHIYVRGMDRSEEVPVFDSGAAAIYGDKLLLSTLAHLPEVMRRPDDIANLVRTVYSDYPPIPEEWSDAWDTACAEDTAKKHSAESRAQTFRMASPTYAEKLSVLFERTHSTGASAGAEERGLAQVRDTEFSVEVVAIVDTEYGYRPVGSDIEISEGTDVNYRDALKLAAHTLRLPARMTRHDADAERILDELEQTTPGEWAGSGILRRHLALRFRPTPDGQLKATVGRFALTYSEQLGLIVHDQHNKS